MSERNIAIKTMDQYADRQKEQVSAGCLYVVATPIGNLADITQRAMQTLAQVDLIACEDTRHTGNLCRHLGIRTPLTSYYREKEQEKAEYLLQELLRGKNIALVSDAGTPAIADPGAVLVAGARGVGIKVLAVPGPSALIAALSLAGRQESAFFFRWLSAGQGRRSAQNAAQPRWPAPCPGLL